MPFRVRSLLFPTPWTHLARWQVIAKKHDRGPSFPLVLYLNARGRLCPGGQPLAKWGFELNPTTRWFAHTRPCRLSTVCLRFPSLRYLRQAGFVIRCCLRRLLPGGHSSSFLSVPLRPIDSTPHAPQI